MFLISYCFCSAAVICCADEQRENRDQVSPDAAAIANAISIATNPGAAAAKKSGKNLTYRQWNLAYDPFSYASSMAGQWSFAATRTHKVDLVLVIVISSFCSLCLSVLL